MKGFLSDRLVQQKEPARLKPQCAECRLYKHCTTPKIVPQGRGKRGILLVTSHVTAIDDEDGVFFSGADGELLKSVLYEYGIDFNKDCWHTASVICKPHEKVPTPDQVRWCAPNLAATIKELKPKVIVTFGMTPTRTVVQPLWKNDIGSFDRWQGWRIPLHKQNAWLCPVFDPSHVRKFERDKALFVCFHQQIEKVSELFERPWTEEPDFRSQVKVVYDTNDAAAILRKAAQRDKPVAFDYETNMLKPDSADSRIVCVSIAPTQDKAYAFPFAGDVVDALREFVKSPVPKIGANLQFENRWTKRHLGSFVRNWHWDVVHGAHVLDNRPDITSVKFQSIVRTGQPLFNKHIEPYLESSGSGGNAQNNINQADAHELLVYCGLDSLLEYKIAVSQKKEMKL